MNSPKTYWLCRAPGSATEGPFTLGQITTMFGAGSLTAAAVLCEVDSQEWMGVVELLEGGGKMAFIHSRKIHSGGSNLLQVILFLIGLVLMFCSLFILLTFPMGAVLMFLVGFAFLAVSAMVRARYQVEYFCSDCGNAVAATSMKCPACKAELDLPPPTWQMTTAQVFWWALYAAIFFALGLMIVAMMTRQ